MGDEIGGVGTQVHGGLVSWFACAGWWMDVVDDGISLQMKRLLAVNSGRFHRMRPQLRWEYLYILAY